MEERAEQLREKLLDAKRLHRAATKVIRNLFKRGKLTDDAIVRVSSGRFYYYVQFSERWRDKQHPKFTWAHPDGYVIISGADSTDEAKYVADRALGRYHLSPVFEGVYRFPEKPLGCLGEFKAEDYRGINGSHDNGVRRASGEKDQGHQSLGSDQRDGGSPA